MLAIASRHSDVHLVSSGLSSLGKRGWLAKLRRVSDGCCARAQECIEVKFMNEKHTMELSNMTGGRLVDGVNTLTRKTRTLPRVQGAWRLSNACAVLARFTWDDAFSRP